MDFLYLLEKIRNPILTFIFNIITEFGYELVALSIICIIFWSVNKVLAYKMGFAFFASGMLVQGLKITFRIQRPWVLDPEFKPVEAAKATATGYSFPSGHTQCATTLFGSLAIFLKKTWMKIICVVMFLLVGLSRMYLGVHTPKDVVVSMLLTLVCVFVFYSLFDKIKDNKKYDWLITLVLVAISLGVALYSIILEKNGVITDPKYALDCCKTGGAGLGFALAWFAERKWIDYDVKTPEKWMQVVKIVIGIAVALALKEVPKMLFDDTAVVGFIRYALVTSWIVGVFPLIVKKVLGKIEK